MASPTLNHTATVTWTGSNAPGTVSIAATVNDIIVIAVGAETTSGAVPTVSSVTATGLTFANRSAFTSAGQGNGTNERTRTEMWWALAASTTTYVVTVSITGGGQTVDDGSIVAFSVSGCNTSAPWDPSVTLPVEAANSTGTNTTPTVSYTLSSGSTFVIAHLNVFDSVPTETPTAGFTTIANALNGGGSLVSYCFLAYNNTSTSGSHSGVTPFDTATSSYIVVADALAAAAAPPPSYLPSSGLRSFVPQVRASAW